MTVYPVNKNFKQIPLFGLHLSNCACRNQAQSQTLQQFMYYKSVCCQTS